jgi:hypothetical protein
LRNRACGRGVVEETPSNEGRATEECVLAARPLSREPANGMGTHTVGRRTTRSVRESGEKLRTLDRLGTEDIRAFTWLGG